MKTISDLFAELLKLRSPEEVRKRAVWEKGAPINGINLAKWRFDDDLNIMHFDEYGRLTEYGWEVNHQVALALGGSDDFANLRPLHWKSNRRPGGLVGALLDGLRK